MWTDWRLVEPDVLYHFYRLLMELWKKTGELAEEEGGDYIVVHQHMTDLAASVLVALVGADNAIKEIEGYIAERLGDDDGSE